jgi:hypothetical protein
MYLSDFYLGRTININQRCIHSCFIILDNVKSVNWPRERSINAAGTTMYGRHHLDCYYINFSCFPWQEFVWWYVLLFFCLLGLANYSRGYAFLCVIWSIVSVTPSRALISQPSFAFDFQLNLILYPACDSMGHIVFGLSVRPTSILHIVIATSLWSLVW